MGIAVGQAAGAAAAAGPRECIATRRIHAWRSQLRHKPVVVLDIVRIGIMEACIRMRYPQSGKSSSSLYRRSPTPHERRWSPAIYRANSNRGAQGDGAAESGRCPSEGVEAVSGMQGWNSGSASRDGGEDTNIESLRGPSASDTGRGIDVRARVYVCLLYRALQVRRGRIRV